MIFNVTQEDIDGAQRGHSMYCPVAIAMRRVLGPAAVLVGIAACALNNRVTRTFPYEVTEFIGKYDAGKPVEPFSFELTIPTET